MNEVLVNAYPKSGVTWLLHLICDLLEGVHKDKPESEPLIYDHPVSSDWIIVKGHYPYWEAAIPYLEGRNVILTQRDPRDVVVSAMYYRKAVNLGLDVAIDHLIRSSYVDWIESWYSSDLRVEKLIATRYENLHYKPVRELRNIIWQLTDITLPNNRIRQALNRQSFASMIDQLGGDRHFMRKGVVGDWKNHFTREHAERFNAHFGEFMLRHRYIDSLDWWRYVST
jgi:hypothetical protein